MSVRISLKGAVTALLVVIVGLMAFLGLPQAVAAPQTLYSMTEDGGRQDSKGNQWSAQSFSTGESSLKLASVGVRIRNTNNANNQSLASTVTVALYPSTTAAPFTPTGSAIETLGSKSFSAGGYQDELVTFPSTTTLAANTQYFVVVTGSAGGTIGWKYNTAAPTSSISPTPGFVSTTSADAGSSWSSFSPQNFNMVVTADPLAPSAPTSVAAVPANGEASVTWTTPSDAGSSAIIDYTVTSSPQGETCITTTTACTVSGLTNGTPYTFTVVARNSDGSGPASIASGAVTPRTVPSAPTGVTATAGNTSTSVSWSAPVSDGGSAITGYTLTRATNSAFTTGVVNLTLGNVLTTSETGLTNGTEYWWRVAAVNDAGTGAASVAASATPLTVPGAPTGVSATAGDASASVSWTAPASDGGSTITRYAVTASPGGLRCVTTTTACSVTGLNNGTSYTFTVVATNGVGDSLPSNSSAAITPRASGGGGGNPPDPDPEPTRAPSASPSSSLSPTPTPTPTAALAPSPTNTSSPRPTRNPSSQVPGEVLEDAQDGPLGESDIALEGAELSEESALDPAASVSPSSIPKPTPTTAEGDAENLDFPAPLATFDAQPEPGVSLLIDQQLVGPVMDLRINLIVGSTVTGRSAVVKAAGMQPDSTVIIQVFSEPQIIGQGTVDQAGNVAIETVLPDGLPAGVHTIMATGVGLGGIPVQSIGVFDLDTSDVVTAFAPPGQVSTPMSPDDPQLGRALAAGKPVYDISLFPAVIATVAVAGAALLGLAGVGGLADSGSGNRSSRGKLSAIVTKKLKVTGAKESGIGDRSRTWAMPFTRRTDDWIKALPVKLGKYSALMPRLLVDGAWARAMFGSMGFLLWGIGLVLGLVSVWSTGFEALPPALPLILAIIVLGILDAAAGAIAWLTITVGAVVTGHVTTWPELRTILGMFVLFASIPLLAHVIRPLRRMLGGSDKDRFDRFADYVMPTVFLAFAATSMFKAINGLSGLELVSSEDFLEIQLVVILAFLLRMAMEDVAINAYPLRSAEVQPARLTSPSKPLALISVAIRAGLFLVIAEPFFGLGWMTYLSAALLAIPMALKVFEDDLPNSVWLNKWFPRGVARFAMVLVIGIYVSFWLLGQNAADEQVRQTYNLILLPGIAVGLIELIGREGWSWPDRWISRALGLVVWIFAVGVVTGLIALV